MAEEQAPPVVAVVVSSDPGPWLEDCLRSLQQQDYANLSILVIDAASTIPIADRVAAVAPQVYLRRLEYNPGFGPAANTVLNSVTGSTHFLFCHDDIVLSEDGLRRMVEEAFRTNAGVVSPKFVDYDEPDRILHVGLSIDRFGAPVRRVERGEFDQSQHDEMREVFAAPGGCTLIRSDLFAAIGGFDPEISMFGEDVDFCWRARLAGARIIVVPLAVCRHREATSARLRSLPKARDLQWRHELRAVLKNYGRIRRPFVVGQLALLSLIEVFYFLLTRRTRRARQVIDAWRWNLASERKLRRARRRVHHERRLPDHVVCALFSRRTSRVWRFVRPMLEELVLHWTRPSDDSAVEAEIRARPHRPREISIGCGVLVLVVLFGARSLVFGHLPLVGQYLTLPSPAQLLGHFFGGYNDAGMQAPGPASPAFAFLGLFGIVLFGAMGLTQKALIVVLIVLGAIGIARLLKPFGSRWASLSAATVYLFLPLAWNDVALGDIRGLVAYAASPYVLCRLARASGLEPFADPQADLKLDGRRRLIHEGLGLGLVLALSGAFAPLIVVVGLVLAVSVAIGCVVSGNNQGGRRVFGVGAAGALIAIALDFPWSITYLQAGSSLSALTGPATSSTRLAQLGALLRFDVGPLGRGLLGWAFLVAALFVLVSGTSDRLGWGIRLWAGLLGGAAFAWALNEGWLHSGGGFVTVALAPIAACIACLVGLGVAILRADLGRAHFGHGQFVAVAFSVLCVVGLLPVLGATLSGRFGLADSGYDSVLSWMDTTGRVSTAERVLWLGDPAVLPLGSWQIRPGLALGVSEGGLPNAERLFPSPDPSYAKGLISAVEQAESGMTVKLGSLLSSAGVRYLIVPNSFAPLLAGAPAASPLPAPAPQVLLDGLAAQSDLRELPEEGDALIFENTAWHPVALPVQSGGSAQVPSVLRGLGVAAEVLAWLMALAYLWGGRTRSAREQRERRSSFGDEGIFMGEDEPVSVGL